MEPKNLRVGQLFRHYGGEHYIITGFSTFSDDGEWDGCSIVEYSRMTEDGTRDERYTTPAVRFCEHVPSDGKYKIGVTVSNWYQRFELVAEIACQ